MKTINIEDFFTEDNEVSGMWFEPKIRTKLGTLEPCGLEFQLTGKDTDENIAATERYEKRLAELEDIKDPIEKARKSKELDAERVAEFVKGIRVTEGYAVNFGGKQIEYSADVVRKIFLKSPLIRAEVIKFVMETANFIKRENNDSKKQ